MSWDFTYELVYYLETKRHQQTFLPSVLHSLNALIHILIFLSLPSIALIDITALTNSFPLLFALLGIFSLILFEIFVLALYKKELYLLQQLQNFRFLFSPLLMLTAITMTKTQKMVGIQGSLIGIVVSLFSGLLSQFLIFQNFRLYSIKSQVVYVVTQWLSFQMLLISITAILNKKLQLVASFLLLVLACNTFYKQFGQINNYSVQNRVLYLITLLHVNIACLLMIHLLFDFSTLSYTFALCSLVVMLYLGLKTNLDQIKLINKMKNVLELKAEYSQFADLVDHFIYVYRANKKSPCAQLQDFIFSILNEHDQNCTLPNCEFLTKKTQQQLMNIKQGSMQILTHKVQKKLQWIFQNYLQQNSDNFQYDFHFLKFYAYCFNNRVKLQKVLNNIDTDTIGWQLRCQHYIFRKMCEEIQNKENIDVAKIDQIFVQFQSNLLSTLTLMQEFWAQFYEEKVDLKHIMKVASKIFPYKSKLEQMATEQLHLENFTSFKILRLYVLYLRTILNNQQLALMLQDHLKITTQRLKDTQNINYLSNETEAGFIVICLSESKLGNVFLVNQKACQLFRYSKKELLQMRVNAIMPKIFAVLHDKILTDFLRYGRRKYNIDQRILFGKDGAGYMFPLHLQLQNTSFTSNDEFIFIAMVKPLKTKEIPIYCIVDHQGYVRDYTASFKKIFYYQSNKQKIINIQQIIPTYFDDDQKQEEKITRTLTVPIKNKKLGDIEAKFEISPVLIKNSHEGFLIKMEYISSNTKFNSRTYSMTQKLKQMRRTGELIAYENQFNYNRNRYQISKNKVSKVEYSSYWENLMIEREIDDSFLLTQTHQKKNYGQGIKIIRYINNHYQRKEQDESFHSQSYDQEYQLDIKTKIENVKQKSQNKETKALVTSFAVTINIFVVMIIIDLVIIYSIYQFENSREIEYYMKVDYDKQTRYLIPEYVIYNSLYNAKINQEYYKQKLDQLQSKIINALIQSPFNQTEKEYVHKLIFRRQTHDLRQLIQSDAISVSLGKTHIQKYLSATWGIVIAGCILLISVIVCIIYKLNGALFMVYTIFLNLNQQAVRSIHQSCRKMIRLIQFQYNESKMNEAQTQQKQKDDQNQIQKIKHFKTLERDQNKVYFLQMTVPIVLIIVLAAVILSLNINSFGLYHTYKTQHYNYFEAIPSTSAQFMKVILKTLQNQEVNMSNNYSFYLQQIQKNLVDFPSADDYDFMSILYGNVCNNSVVVASAQILSCNQIQNGILKTGIASSLNYLSEQFKKISLSTVNDPTKMLSLLELQFKFVIPIMKTVQEKMQEMLRNYIHNDIRLFQSLTLSVIGLFVLYNIYLFCLPLKHIENQIKFTNGMIALMPQDSFNPKNTNTLARSKRN